MNLKRIIIIFIIIFFPFKKTFSLENKILVYVNNEIITTIDVFKEIEYLKFLNRNLNNLEKNIVIEIAKNSLISEIIKKKIILEYTNEIKVEDKYLEDPIKKIYQSLGINTLDEFVDYLNRLSLSLDNVKQKVSLEIFWKEFIFSKFSNQIIVDKNKIRQDLEKNQNELINAYFLSELIFSNENNDIDQKFSQIKKDIEEKGFKNAVLIHSIADSKNNNGGEIGWLNETSLNKKTLDIVKELTLGNYSDPIIIPGGYLIIKLDDLKKIKNQKTNVETEIEKIVFDKTNEQLNNFSYMYINKMKKEFTIYEK